MGNILQQIFSGDFILSVFLLSTPIMFAALGAIVASKSGVTNIGLEGIMLFAALFGVLGSGFSNSVFVGMLLGLAAGLLIAALMAVFILYLKTDAIVTGIIVNLMGAGGTIFLLEMFTGDKNVSTSVVSGQFPVINIPFIENIPVVGQILSGHSILTYFAFLCVVLLWLLLKKTHFGMKLRAVGENSLAASSLGINVRRTRFIALLISGGLAAFGGMFLSMAYVSNFMANMTAGRGFIALAAEAMGMSNPILTMLTSMFFGLTNALAINFGSGGFSPVLNEFFEMLPYIATILLLVIYSSIRISRSKKQNNKNKTGTVK